MPEALWELSSSLSLEHSWLAFLAIRMQECTQPSEAGVTPAERQALPGALSALPEPGSEAPGCPAILRSQRFLLPVSSPLAMKSMERPPSFGTSCSNPDFSSLGSCGTYFSVLRYNT